MPAATKQLSPLMNGTLVSIQIGQLRSEGSTDATESADKPWTTGFYKQPVAGPVRLTRDGLVGDQVADKRHHGGPDKAVLAYAVSHYELWREELPAMGFDALPVDFGPGALAENLTVAGLTERDVCIGDTWQVGSEVRLQVSQPRQPCWKINRRWRVKTFTKRVAQTGRTGWYLRVLQAGEIHPGDELRLIERPNLSWSVARANDVLMGRELDQYAAMELLALPELAPAWKQSLS